jgi:diketogulonate reductase-like aldo/keto reductase
MTIHLQLVHKHVIHLYPKDIMASKIQTPEQLILPFPYPMIVVKVPPTFRRRRIRAQLRSVSGKLSHKQRLAMQKHSAKACLL